MANPADPGTFDYWITNRMTFWVAPPLSGDTGDFDRWITDRMDFRVYVEATAAAVVGQVYPSRRHPSKNVILRL